MKKAIVIILTSLIIINVSACSKLTEEPILPAERYGEQNGPIELKLAAMAAPSELKRMVDDFNKSNSEYKITITNYDQRYINLSTLRTEMTAGK